MLVVEDDAILRAAIEEIMTDDGHEVRQAGNGREALQRLDGWDPDVVILDLMMPVMDAFAFRDHQAAGGTGGSARLLVLSAARDVESAAARLRADAWLAKPFSLVDLSETVERLVRDD